ncbi:MAG: EAL domain-containing protein [Syntrophales bacterium]|jgi:diguanylate cyclase (GGDEF)-like protein/PAS domain S-box-containing protein|nr:EAL domain-containing protein [Syntrophales bacterium]
MRKNLTVIILAAVGLLTVFFLTFYIHQTNKERVLSQFNNTQLLIARQTTRQIESYLRFRSSDLRRFFSSAALQDPGRKKMTVDILSNFERLKRFNIKEISLLDEKGTASYSTTAMAIGENHSQDNFFSWARDPVNKGSVWIWYEKGERQRIPVTAGSPVSTHIGIFLATPLYRESAAGGRQKPGDKFAGALMFKVDLEKMVAEQSIVFTPLMKSHKFWIMDKEGTVLLQSEHPEMVMRNIREKDGTCNQCHASFNHIEMMLGKTEGVTEYQLKGEPKKLAAFASMSVENVSWIVVENAPLDEVTAFVWKDFKKTLLLLGIVVFILGIAFFWAYRNYRGRVDHETLINTLLSISLLDIHLEEQLAKMLETIISISWLKVEAKGCIFLVKEKSDVLVMVVQKGLSPLLATTCAEVPFGRCICGRAALKGEIEFVKNVDERHENLFGSVSPHGHYCVPIKFHGKVLGVLNLYLRAGHRRDKREEEFLKAITDVVAGIIERKRAEEELQLSEERFRRIFDEGPVGMILANPDYTIIAVNKVLCGLLGYSEQELADQSIADITCEEDREKDREFSAQLFADSLPVLHLEKRYVRKDGGIMWAKITASALHGKEDNMLYGLIIIEDLTESKKATEKIHLLHYYDSLTGLPNRTFHKELIKRSIEHAHRHKEIFALIYIGLDNFQRINDTLGYNIGDILLKAVADRLTHSLRKSDDVARSDEGEAVSAVSRCGGDEFIVLVHDLNQAQGAAIAARHLLEEISTSYDLNGREVFMTASIGIALYPDDGTDVDDLLKNAEKAMRCTKSEGKSNYQFYSGSMNSFVLELLTLESDLHMALARNELVLYYQPKVDAATRMVKGMEALIRWKHPDRGLIPPLQFIPLAETSGLIIPIGEFVIRTVCGQIKTWQEAGYQRINIALNLSSRQFDQQNLIEIVKEALQDTMISPQCLELEITESVIMRNPEKAIQILTELNAQGIGISIDDFGTGYSSLSYLKRLPLDYLKIDQSFVKGLASDPKDQAIVKTTIAMAHSLNLKTIAEGVETEEQLSFLQEHECDEIQGYLFSRPLPAEEIPGILAKGYL